MRSSIISEAEIRRRSDEVISIGMQFHLGSGSFRYRGQVVTQQFIETADEDQWNEIYTDVYEKIQILKKYLPA